MSERELVSEILRADASQSPVLSMGTEINGIELGWCGVFAQPAAK
jgi:hypothetical protein